ncbi:hypothetical protein CCACVL1_01835, partial [Corchorus capsularis]
MPTIREGSESSGVFTLTVTLNLGGAWSGES